MKELDQLSVAVVGDDLAAWMAAAFFSSQACFAPQQVSIYMGVTPGDYAKVQWALPDLNNYFNQICVPPDALAGEGAIERTLGSHYQLPNRDFWHIWGEYGASQGAVEFHQLVSRLLQEGASIDYEGLSIAAAFAKKGVAKEPSADPDSIFSTYESGYCVNTDVFIGVLKKISKANGVIEVIDRVESIQTNKNLPVSIVIEGGVSQSYSLVVNTAPGLISKDREFEDWSDFLPFTQVSKILEKASKPAPVQTINFNQSSGWSKRATSQGLTENIEYRTPAQLPLSAVEYSPQAVGALQRFANNGLIHMGKGAADFPSPLVSEVDVIWIKLRLLWKYLAYAEAGPTVADVYNQAVRGYLKNLRDLSQRSLLVVNRRNNNIAGDDSNLQVTTSSQHKYDLFAHRGRIAVYECESIKPLWQIWLLLGLGVTPTSVDPLVAGLSPEEVNTLFSAVERAVKRESEAI